ncbi:hypothetical protein EFP20_08295 [Burkholderia glumae]|nr:hypothetical protein EFP20_08295 [Burkholderia glumae]
MRPLDRAWPIPKPAAGWPAQPPDRRLDARDGRDHAGHANRAAPRRLGTSDETAQRWFYPTVGR